MLENRLEALRRAMKAHHADLCYVPTADAHGSEYPGVHDKAREYLSGFTGSAGILVVTADWAGLWTDGRYFLQAEIQLRGTEITLYKSGEPGVPSIEDEIDRRLPQGGILAYDGTVVSRKVGEVLREIAMDKTGRALLVDLPGEIWTDRPPVSAEPVYELPLAVAGESRSSKLWRLRDAMEEQGADCHILTSLDDIAWLTNLRGNDIPCNPVFLSYCVVTLDQAVLFVQEGVVSEAIRRSLRKDGVELRPYGKVFEELPGLIRNRYVLIDRETVSDRVYICLKRAREIYNGPSPVALMKAVKNEAETRGMKAAHLKDGIAVTKFLYWVKTHVGKERITELSAAEKLEKFRQEQEHYMGPSFKTIAAYGANGAIVHYSATEKTDTELSAEGFFLVDSGGQYLEGTTDITRTIVLGALTEEQKRHFTAVLRGMLALGDAKFLHGCTGINLDYLAREPLWSMGLDYNHGTGHGVGCLLNVHEGPNGIRWRGQSVVFEPGMVTSDEPGFYLAGQYGIRTENLMLCRRAEQSNYGRFLEFEFLSLVPIDKEGIDWEQMELKDICRLNRYHKAVYDALAPYFSGDARSWLEKATSPVCREKIKI